VPFPGCSLQSRYAVTFLSFANTISAGTNGSWPPSHRLCYPNLLRTRSQNIRHQENARISTERKGPTGNRTPNSVSGAVRLRDEPRITQSGSSLSRPRSFRDPDPNDDFFGEPPHP
jgi:hypothetical protein